MDAGIPQAIKDLTLKFPYNNLAAVEELFRRHPKKIAAVILEAEKEVPPAEGYLKCLRELCDREGALLILDEMITGFRWHNGGAQTYYDLKPDLSTFGKGLGNGFALSALVGRGDVMSLGGLDHDKPRVFLLSTTHGAETHALAAGREVIRTYQREPVVARLWEQGKKLADGLRQAAADAKVGDHFEVVGRPCCLTYVTRDADKKPSQEFRTLFLQETIKRGVIAPSLVVSYSHTDEDVQATVEAAHGALTIYRKALDEGIGKHMEGKPVKPVFRKFN
jgi:glutamate-1-semialdehyde 2,1-aminomutase